MIDFYRVWKDDKDSEPKVKSKKKGFTCVLCSKQVNGLATHMDDVHGKGTWKSIFLRWKQSKKNVLTKSSN